MIPTHTHTHTHIPLQIVAAAVAWRQDAEDESLDALHLPVLHHPGSPAERAGSVQSTEVLPAAKVELGQRLSGTDQDPLHSTPSPFGR